MSSVKKISIANVIIMGGGRWARVLTEVLCDLLSPSANIFIFSPKNHLFMNEWVAQNKEEKRIKVITSFPNSFHIPHVVIVANAARDHYKSVLAAISAGADVLVEKPIVLNYKEALEIDNFAKKNNKIVCASHVFLFASYLEKFSKLIQVRGKIEKINISWEDSVLEKRHGELKNFDVGLPIIVDCLPHILSIISKFTLIDVSYNSIKLQISNGGSKVNMYLESSGISINICMVRNGVQRKRFIEILVGGKKSTLDFSTEPGIIKFGNKKISGDLNWNVGPKPLKQLLNAFLFGTNVRQFDKRLEFKFGILVSKIIDETLRIYKNLQLTWVINIIKIENNLNKDLVYAINELNLSNGLGIDLKIDKFKLNKETKVFLHSKFNQLLIENKTSVID